MNRQAEVIHPPVAGLTKGERDRAAKTLRQLATQIQRGLHDAGTTDGFIRMAVASSESALAVRRQSAKKTQDLRRNLKIAILLLAARQAGLQRGAMKSVAMRLGEINGLSVDRIHAIAFQYRDDAAALLEEASADQRASMHRDLKKLKAFALARFETFACRS